MFLSKIISVIHYKPHTKVHKLTIANEILGKMYAVLKTLQVGSKSFFHSCLLKLRRVSETQNVATRIYNFFIVQNNFGSFDNDIKSMIQIQNPKLFCTFVS